MINRGLIRWIWVVTCLSCLLCACDRPSQSDSRLLTVDRLMGENPDSALVQLKVIGPKQLGSDADRAYYALLLTQANYKCYIPATSDSVINIALDYYTHHKGDREKLTRALIYKGAVMEELGQPEEAIVYYKDAQNTVADDDAFNQGYIRLRLGQVYNSNYVWDCIDVSLFKEALHYFKQVPDSFYILACLSQIGSAYLKTDRDSVMPYLYQADSLAKTLHEKYLEQVNLIYMADVKMYGPGHHDIDSAKNIALSILRDPGHNKTDDDHLLMIAAYTLAKQGKPDSSYYYLSQVDNGQLPVGMRVLYEKCLAEAAISKGDIAQYRMHYEQADDLTDSVMTCNLQQQLREVDARYDNEVLKNENLRKKALIALLVAATLALAGILAVAVLFLRQRRRQLKDSMDTIERLHDDAKRLTTQLANNESMNERLKRTIRHQIDVFMQLVEKYNIQYAQNSSKFNRLFKESYNLNQPDGTFWDEISSYADDACGGIITHVLEQCPSMADSDVKFLSLCCCNLPATAIMACMGYNDIHSVYNKKRRIAELLEYPGKLDDYILEWMESHGC